MITLSHIWPLMYRTIVMYAVILLVVRLMGKRSLANMAPFDLVVILIIGEAAAIPIQEDDIPLWHGILPILLLALLEFLVTLANLYSKKFEHITQGRATLLIKQGRIMYHNMRREHVTEADIISLLRDRGVDSFKEVKEAWLEPNGALSVIQNRADQPLNLKLFRQAFPTEDLERMLDAKLQEFKAEVLRSIRRDAKNRLP